MDETLDAAHPNDAFAQLGKLIIAGASPDWVVQEVGTIVASWAAEPEMDSGVAQARIERLWDSLSKDAADLQEQIADAEGGDAQALAQAKRVLAAMTAAVTALAAAHERV